MRPVRLLRGATFAVLLAASAVGVAACDGKEAKTANVKAGPMPEGESWTGVYYNPVFGYLHLIEEGSNIIGKWKRTDQSHWGSLEGTFQGNVLHYKWKEHQVGMVGASATTQGKGYFVYAMDKENHATLDGQFGFKDEETGSEWHNVKQAKMAPDLKSIGGDAEGVAPGGF